MKTLLFCLSVFWTLTAGGSFFDDKALRRAVSERPFPEYAEWWSMGEEFSSFMSEAIVMEWRTLAGNEGDLAPVKSFASKYIDAVYSREARASLVDDFVETRFSTALQSGEFDAVSYAFFRSAFEIMEDHRGRYRRPLEEERRLFTRRVGRNFFERLESHLGLRSPRSLDDGASFGALKRSIDAVIGFLDEQGYFRDGAAFRFDVDVEHRGRKIRQEESAVVESLRDEGRAWALFEMSYPVILPSAVYLYQTKGEAQHHSSRTIEELFGRVGYAARESHGFDPAGYPSDMVVEFWEIRRAP